MTYMIYFFKLLDFDLFEGSKKGMHTHMRL